MKFKQTATIFTREFNYMWRDRGLRHILIIVPLLGIVVFWGIYCAQTLKDIPTAVVDLDRSQTSRELVQQLQNAEYLKVVAYPLSYTEEEKMVERGQVVVGVVIPENFGRDVSNHQKTNVFTVIDGSNMIYATNASSAVLTITRTISAEAGIKDLIAGGMQYKQAQDAYRNISLQEEFWFNPTVNYAYFLVMAMIMNIWQQCCMLASCLNIIGETGVRSWLQIKASGFSKFRFFLSKSLAHITVFMLIAVVLYFVCFGILKLPLQCGWGVLVGFTLVTVLALHAIGTMMSSLAVNAVDSARFGMMVALPAFVLSGYTWPIEAMPGFLQKLVWILPQTWYLQGLNYLTFKNPGWDFMFPYFRSLLIIAAVCYGVATLATALKER